ncbi:MAG: hypothetical protein ACK532_02040, partial [Acidobacteriota bacterium]
SGNSPNSATAAPNALSPQKTKSNKRTQPLYELDTIRPVHFPSNHAGFGDNGDWAMSEFHSL